MTNRVLFLLLFLLAGCLFSSCTEGNTESRKEVPPVLLQLSDERMRPSLRLDFFPLGFYYVSHYSEQKERRLRDVETIAQGGFNTLHTPIDRNDKPLLDFARDNGIAVIAENNDDRPDELVTIFRNHPALYAWGTFDDVDSKKTLGAAVHPLPEVQTAHAKLKVMAPSSKSYISGGNAKRFAPYVSQSDLYGIQAYPVPDEEISSVYHFLKKVKNAIGDSEQALIANLQTFPWHGKERWPTPAEIRNMTYQALLAKVDGILFYTFFDEVTDLSEQPEVWKELLVIQKQLTFLDPWIRSGRFNQLLSPDQDIIGGRWEIDNQAVYIIVNLSAKLRNIAFELSYSGRVHELFKSDAPPRTLRSIQVELPSRGIVAVKNDFSLNQQ